MNNIKKFLAAVLATTMVFAVGCSEEESSSEAKVVYYDDSNEYTQEAEAYENSDGEVVAEDRIAENVKATPVKKGESAELGTMNVEFVDVYSAGIIESSDMGGEYNYNREVIAVSCNLTNNSDATESVTAFDFVVKYLDGDETELYTGSEAMLGAQEKITDIESFNSDVEPGSSLSGYAAFAVYSEWETMTIYYNPTDDDKNEAISFEITRDMVQQLG